MGILSTSKNFKLKEDAAGSLAIDTQGTGLVNGLIAKVTGLFDGGMSGATGAAHTLFEATLAVAPAALEHKRQTGEWGIPFVGKPVMA